MNKTLLKDLIEKPITGEWGLEGNRIKVLRSTNFSNKGVIDLKNLVFRDIPEHKIVSKKLKKGDIIIEKSGGGPNQPVGRVVYFDLDEEFICNNFTSILRPRITRVFPKYLHYFLFASHKFGLTQSFQNKTIGIINLQLSRYVDNLKIPLPPLETQKRIAQILDEAAALRDKTKQLLTEYDLLAQSIFFEMFGDPLANPKKWKVSKLKELSTKIGSGNTPKGGSKVYVGKGISFFRSQNVWKKNLIMDDIAFIDQETHEGMKKSSLKHGDILMTKTGRINTENSSLGRPAMYLGEDDKANLNGHVYLIRLKKDVQNEYILFILTTNQYREHIRRVCVGGIDKRQLNKNHLEEFPIIYPPMKLQKEFTEKLKLINQQKELAKQELKESKDLFNCLLQKAFKGELV
ncbi:MAG TPA: restriction endonuclease subunit S [Maribacter sp.]|nr:restriction endonuclease subunit S [Maribacter sp.]